MSNKFQPIDFHDVDDFLAFLPDDERKIVDKLRSIVLECLPDGKEKLAYNVPFYYRHRRVLFIWPSAVPWGKVRPGGVQLGFCEGHRLPDDIGWLEKGTRKQVYYKTFFTPQEVDPDLVRAYVYAALEVDEQPR